MDPFVPTDLSFAARYEYLLLPKLNEISQMLIAPVHTYMKVFRLQGGGTRYEGKRFVFRFMIFKVHQLLNQNVLSLGSVLNVEQDINAGIVNELPNMPKDIPCFVVRRGRNQDSVNNYK